MKSKIRNGDKNIFKVIKKNKKVMLNNHSMIPPPLFPISALHTLSFLPEMFLAADPVSKTKTIHVVVIRKNNF